MRLFFIVLFALAPIFANAQEYPSRAVRIVVPQPAGGGYDTVTRAIAKRLQELWGSPVVVDNRSGAAGIIGTQSVATATPDGYTFLMGGIGPHAINPALYPQLPYDPRRDFAPVVEIGFAPNFLVVNPALPAKSVRELVALLKGSATPLSFGNNGTGSSTHLGAEMFLQQIGAKGVHIPYRGSAPTAVAVLANEVSIVYMNVLDMAQHVKAGKLRALAVATRTRSSLFPDVPTIGEAGVPGAESSAWMALFAPAGTPVEIIRKVNADVNKVLSDPEVKAFFARIGTELTGGTPDDLAKFLDAEIAKWDGVVKKGNITGPK